MSAAPPYWTVAGVALNVVGALLTVTSRLSPEPRNPGSSSKPTVIRGFGKSTGETSTGKTADPTPVVWPVTARTRVPPKANTTGRSPSTDPVIRFLSRALPRSGPRHRVTEAEPG